MSYTTARCSDNPGAPQSLIFNFRYLYRHAFAGMILKYTRRFNISHHLSIYFVILHTQAFVQTNNNLFSGVDLDKFLLRLHRDFSLFSVQLYINHRILQRISESL